MSMKWPPKIKIQTLWVLKIIPVRHMTCKGALVQMNLPTRFYCKNNVQTNEHCKDNNW